jgi:predicted transcriptional regulator
MKKKAQDDADDMHRAEQRSIRRRVVDFKRKLDKTERAFVNAIINRRSRKPGKIGWAHISMRELEQTTGFTETAIRPAIKRLIKRGIVEPEMKGKYAGAGNSNSYKLHNIDACYQEPPKQDGPTKEASK